MLQTFYISIHAPHAGCDTEARHERHELFISIHAPRAGCDLTSLRASSTPSKFQSTHPVRGATPNSQERAPSNTFQSTHPVRGATAYVFHPRLDHCISIHAPLAGCDGGAVACGAGGAISIHAPLAGCDTKMTCSYSHSTYFNPRTPCGVRLCGRGASRAAGLISIHAPLAGCDRAGIRQTSKTIQFQSTHPLRGATRQLAPHPARRRDFNPRTPCGVRPSPMICTSLSDTISIHAPLAGCD